MRDFPRRAGLHDQLHAVVVVHRAIAVLCRGLEPAVDIDVPGAHPPRGEKTAAVRQERCISVASGRKPAFRRRREKARDRYALVPFAFRHDAVDGWKRRGKRQAVPRISRKKASGHPYRRHRGNLRPCLHWQSPLRGESFSNVNQQVWPASTEILKEPPDTSSGFPLFTLSTLHGKGSLKSNVPLRRA